MQNKDVNNFIYMEGVSKYFGKVIALNNVHFSINPREIVGLVGDNGAGKSTLIKILSGIYMPTKGTIYLNGKKTKFSSPRAAINAGIETTHQDLALVDDLEIHRNIFMGREPEKLIGGFLPKLNKKEMIYEAEKALDNIGIKNDKISVEDIVRNLSILELMVNLKEAGSAVIFISHNIHHVFSIADRLTVLSRGKKIADLKKNETTEQEISNIIMNN